MQRGTEWIVLSRFLVREGSQVDPEEEQMLTLCPVPAPWAAQLHRRAEVPNFLRRAHPVNSQEASI